jgi:protein-S-isoprenylcysteine O-methyltransferase Ste14
MIRWIAKATGFVVYFFITLEMLFMITPFALYYYSIDRPLLAAFLRSPFTAWLPAFFLPHLSMEILPNIGNLIFLLGLIGFLVGAFQIYRAKFTGRGVVGGGLYRRIRHPQYLFLAIAGFGLLLTWPRFILLFIYLNMLWFYYFLARSEENRMEVRFGDGYREVKRRSWMFLPWEPGGFLQRHVFGWIHGHKARLATTYICSLVLAIALAFVLRQISLAAIEHTLSEQDKIAAISFVPISETDLDEIVRPATVAQEIQSEKVENRWVLAQVMQGKGSVVHTLIDAGMTHQQARRLNLAQTGMKLVFSKQAGEFHAQPFSPLIRWRPVAIVELDKSSASNLIRLERDWFSGNPVMPIF